ncbi:hypothetical protein [Polynucleobacter asymbioticus]|jgi:uncharacterized membrane protein YgdD (TMEM256/DUF423 family)|uniref:YrhK domain-containing protein n=1 Tax=Polynucleobacter asymbioticus (strain DSM 18221 / CIP 109841 / QLW-P1DMWA-1) TaxID=312153 RepID=A4SWB6_POLAQ|nr:hypothetical protein [Polynucleobacter asymbioticus]ABP33780.1 hypothetical protein Pnuc_0560 [Polynucleobacter asymbioticus QLW-P1DMWA-1]APC05584.1 hypothetical protein AOC10_03050 [Polynucleobacter asymbioticus]
MEFLRTTLKELRDLFIDDGNLVFLLLSLIAIISIAVKWLGLQPILGGILLLIGYLTLLTESVMRYRRKNR